MKNGPVPVRRLRALVEGFSRRRILVLGDLMLDQFIRGKVSRISPEAPVPVVQVTSEAYVPGGAGNVCSNLASLQAKVAAVSLVGEDEAGQRLLSIFQERGVDTSGILGDSSRPTTQKCRVVADHQQVVRYDRETAQPIDSRTQERVIAAIRKAVSKSHAIIISDYGKGIVSPKVLKQAIAAARRAKIPIVVDPKIEHFMRYQGVDCLTPNLHEAWTGMRMLPQDDEISIRELGAKILQKLRSKSVLITRSEKGMTLFEKRSPIRITHIPAQAREVFDVTGAGDTVISVLTLALACGGSLLESSILANHAAGIVVGKLGTATTSIEELQAVLK